MFCIEPIYWNKSDEIRAEISNYNHGFRRSPYKYYI